MPLKKIITHSFTVQYDGRSNVLKTPVKVSTGFDPRQTAEFPTPKDFIAIWDTGATGSVITKKVIVGCNLKPIGMAQIHTVAGIKKSEIFLINMTLPNKVSVAQARVTEGIIYGDADVLIGMDIIGAGDFAVTNKNRKTTFSFRMPSVESIDFVKQKQPGTKKLPKVGRNDPCPCGSGKKYKYCCGK